MKRLISLALTLVLMLSMMLIPSHAEAAGMTFSADKLYTTSAALGVLPHTYEATLKIPSTVTGRAGIIMGNYDASPCLNFEIAENGAPRIFYGKLGTAQYSWIFNQVNVCTDEWVHLAIVWDEVADTLSCYVDGVCKQTLTIDDTTVMISGRPMGLGGDMRVGNTMYFKGELGSVALYSDARSASEIASDVAASSPDQSDLVLAYDLMGVAADAKVIPDLSANDLDAALPGSSEEGNSLPDQNLVSGGLRFEELSRWEGTKAMTAMPLTWEATVRLPSTVTARAGVVAGNYGSDNPCVNFEIHENGNPRLYIADKSGGVHDYKFNSVDVATGTWAHVAITVDSAANQVRCYLNGQLAQTLPLNLTDLSVSDKPLAIGSDRRGDNTQYFKGDLARVALYSDVRTAAEIQADVNSVSQDGLMMHYDLSQAKAGDTSMADLSGNGYAVNFRRLTNSSVWVTQAPTVGEYDYSFAVVGDTQVLSQHFPDKLDGLYDWLVANAAARKMKYVLGMGDITETNVDVEWQRAKTNIQKLNPVVPYSLCRGNHDGSAKFNEYFSISDYPDTVGGSYNGKMENTWRELVVGKIKYLIFTLDFGAADGVLNWAGDVIEAHPDHNVIITTHAYLFRDGTTLDAGDVAPPSNHGGTNNGDQLWDKFVSKHKNIVLVLSGHDPCNEVVLTQTKGVHGNTVSQMLVDPQGTDVAYWGTGMVAMLYFSNEGRTVQVEYYSTDRSQWLKQSNQFTFQLDVVVTSADETEAQAVTDAIQALPAQITLENEAQVKAARAAYDALTQGGKGLVTNYAKLTAAEATIADLKAAAEKAEADKAAADGVIALIEALPLPEEITLADKEAVEAARAAYEALTEAQKALVPGEIYNELLAAEYELPYDVIEPPYWWIKDLLNTPLEEITLADKEAVEAARAAYEALTDEQKALVAVEDLAKLIALEEVIAALEQAAADQAAAQAVMDAIQALTEASSEEEVLAALYAYEALTEDQQLLVSVDALAKLESLIPIGPVDPPVVISYGDADGNGKVDAADALKALQHAVKLITLEDDDYTAANVNGDDKIDATDALLMLQYTVKLIDKFPVETVA